MRYGFAHRGGRGHGPDNVIPTFAKALADGATGLETDAWVSADGIVVLDHDGIHRAGTPDERSITEIARAELDPHIPTLAELYQACGTDFDLAIDVKGEGTAQAIRDAAAEAGASARLWLFTEYPQVPGAVGEAHVGVTVRGRDLHRRVRDTALAQLANDGVQVVNARWPHWHRSAVDAVHAVGMLAFAWDVQWSLARRRCERLGIDGIFSDHVRILRPRRGRAR